MKKHKLNNIEDSELQLVVFDGVCNFCNSWVEFVHQRDSNKQFFFAPLQSDLGNEIINKYKIDSTKIDSIMYLKGKKLHLKSSAALRILKDLGGIWALLFVFIIVPPFIRNFVYDVIAKNRYKWFGKKDQCMIPEDHLRNQFLDY